jgi:hypothetical protein
MGVQYEKVIGVQHLAGVDQGKLLFQILELGKEWEQLPYKRV